LYLGAERLRREPDRLHVVFVQTAGLLEVSGEQLILREVGASTIYFGYGPQPLAGHMPTSEFLELWEESAYPLTGDSMQAVVSFTGEGNGRQQAERLVVVLGEPRLDCDTLVYKVDLLEGTPPEGNTSGHVFLETVSQESDTDFRLSAELPAASGSCGSC
jgi:hypothetical protein